MAKDTFFKAKNYLNLRGKLIPFSQIRVWGILNITPDSFYDGGRHNSVDLAVKKVDKMAADGMSVLDLGAVSSRPGAEPVSAKVELERLLPVFKVLRKEFNQLYFSVDTNNAETAKVLLEEGADIINDISGGLWDENMLNLTGNYKCPVVLMHLRGSSATMQLLNNYQHLVADVLKELSSRINAARELGNTDIIVDPGFGFAKNVEQNYTLLNSLSHWKLLELPCLVGVSRKSMIYKPLGISAEESLNGTSALNLLAIKKGADFLRVHDVKEAVELFKLNEYLKIRE